MRTHSIHLQLAFPNFRRQNVRGSVLLTITSYRVSIHYMGNEKGEARGGFEGSFLLSTASFHCGKRDDCGLTA
ncbi:unnamed protein product [Allacma fusca]|uniref:Uncharacterized protein n=1 Tax=Allacma fusca TaxID=39272 RepID=A0A8J2LNS2_9HEXA|nr:unnamed protein product [Allacma fusca]